MKNIFTSLSIKELLVFALLIRLLIMPFYFHPDIKTYHFQSSFLKNGVWNIYSYLIDNRESLPLKEEFVYFPLTYLFLGGYQFIASPLLGSDFDNWLFDASQTANERTGVYRYLFILKMPYLVLDILIGGLLYKLARKEDRKKILTLWLLNPFTLVLIYMFSNIDIIIVALTLLSALLISKNKLSLAALCLGIGAGFKAYPIFFVPLLFVITKGYYGKIKVLLFSLGSFLLIIGPFLFSSGFRQATLTSGLMTRITNFGINIGFGESLIIIITAFTIFFFWSSQKINDIKTRPWLYFLITLLLFFPFIHYHIQWLLWILPFLVLLVVNNKQLFKFSLLWILLAVSIPFLYNDKAMTMGLFSAISPFYNMVPIPFTVVQKVYDPYLVQSIIHSVLTGLSLFLLWKVSIQINNENN